ncbi:hypothetical protein [Nostoc sp.]|uniref:hypothetical protein n=1 Tax=Nostoc sp. TaxID=1180 RepID=UPI002FF4E580
MRLPIKDEINIIFAGLSKLIEGWNSNIQVLLTQEEEDKAKALEAALGSIYALKTKLNDEIDKLTQKVEKEITNEKKKTR